MLFRVPMDSLTNSVVDLDAVLGGLAGHLAEQLHDAATWADQVRLLDALLIGRLTGTRAPPREISTAWRRLHETSGQISVAGLADEVGLSRQRLFARFREEIGLGPKTLARVLRFQHALRLLARDRQPNLATIAHACGYYDQAHFNRDFRKFAGSTPTEHLARRLPDDAGVSFD
jgi:AraC-like DNA-binding protein